MRSLVILTVLTVALGSASSRAATLKVPQQFATIQAAVGAASPGDRIKVANGVYIENVSVPFGLDDLTIEGSGKTIIDARVLGAVGSGGAIVVTADRFIARNLTVRHAKGVPAIGLLVTGDDAVIDRVTALHCAATGIQVVGDRARIDRCAAAVSGLGIYVIGNETNVLRSNVRVVVNAGIFVNGTLPHVDRCTVTRSDFDGILTAGSSPTVSRCTVVGARNSGLFMNGGGNANVTKNIVRGVGDVAGIVVAGFAGGLIEGNRVSDVRTFGIRVWNTASNLAVHKNRVERAGPAAAGFAIAGSNCVLTDNLARACDGDGFLVSGPFNTLEKNRALANDEDGIDVAVGPTTLTNNVASKNGAEGIENNAAGSIFIANVAQGNRFDVANSGGFAQFDANVYGSGGTGFLPQIDV